MSAPQAFLDPGSRDVPGPGCRVLVIGLGISGLAAAKRLGSLGADVTVVDLAEGNEVRARASDLGPARVLLGRSDPRLVDGSDLVVASPGVTPRAPELLAARERGIPVWSEVELAWRLSRAPILGVTGTNGKTTTTEMLAAALKAAGYGAIAAGNIGHPLTEAVASDHDVIVAELSSFQLHHIVSFRAPIGALLNLAEDHLDWHGSFEEYARAKGRLFENQRIGDVAVARDDKACRSLVGDLARLVPFSTQAPPSGGAGVDGGWIVVPQGRVVRQSELRGRSRGHVANAIAAAAAACAFGADPESVGAALASFDPLPNRMELVAEVDGVEFVNDSKATNPHATLAALQDADRIVLIAGGRNKDLDLSQIAVGGVKAVVAIGEAAAELKQAFERVGVPVERAGSMAEAVEVGAGFASPGDTVLLSPACASFDMYRDYKARGEAFREAVRQLRTRRGAVKREGTGENGSRGGAR